MDTEELQTNITYTQNPEENSWEMQKLMGEELWKRDERLCTKLVGLRMRSICGIL
jgi:hypothetical protein